MLSRPTAIALSIILAACSAGPNATRDGSEPHAPVSHPLGAHDGIAEAVFTGVNEARAREGARPLSRDPGLDALALEHSEAMASGRVKFGHAGLSTRMAAALAQSGAKRGAENVSSQPRAASEVAPKSIERWLGSPPHRKNMLGPYGLTGIGVARAQDGRYFVTEIFVE